MTTSAISSKNFIIILLLILFSFIIIITLYQIFFEYSNRYSNCQQSKNEEVIVNCGYFLSQDDTLNLYIVKINQLNSNRIRNAALIAIEETENNKEFLNKYKVRILEECFQNGQGCFYSYVEAYQEGNYGLEIDLQKVYETYIQFMKNQSINNEIKYDFILYNFANFLKSHPHFKECRVWSQYATPFLQHVKNKEKSWYYKRVISLSEEIDCKIT